MKIRPQSACTDFRALLPFANYFDDCSCRVWQPSEESNGCLALIFNKLQYAKQPLLLAAGCHTQPRKFKFIKSTKVPLLSAQGCHTPLDGQHCPLRTSRRFSRAEKPSENINSHLFFMNKKAIPSQYKTCSPRHFPSPKLGKISLRVLFLAFDLCVL
jgi:hypothetical protein